MDYSPPEIFPSSSLFSRLHQLRLHRLILLLLGHGFDLRPLDLLVLQLQHLHELLVVFVNIQPGLVDAPALLLRVRDVLLLEV